MTGRRGAARAQLEGLLVFAVGLVLTSASLAVLSAVVDQPGATLQQGVLLLANLTAGLVRFVLLCGWVFAPRREPQVAAV